METFRVFVAITPDDSILDAVEARVQTLKREITAREVRWEQRSKWHVTLRFLGDVPSVDIPGLTSALEASCAGKRHFRAQARGLGGFPSLKRPRVLWAGIEELNGELMALQASIAEVTSPFAEKDEGRFHPHLTIARIKVENRRLSSHISAIMEATPNADFGEWDVRQVELWRSILSPGGSRYELLAAIPLAS